MAFNKEKEALRNMILTFRVSELQMLLGFAGRNQSGKKTELQDRSLELLQLNSTPVQKRIRELFQSSQETQQAAMIPGANALQYSAAYAQMLGLAGFTTQQQGIPQAGRANPYAAQQAQAQVAAYTAAYGTQPLQAKPNQTVSQPCNVKFKQLPFYDIHGELLKPTSLVTQGSSRFQEAQFQFLLSPEQATNIASNRDIRMGSKLDYLYQIQLRFCLLDPSAEQGDEFPPSICVQVNGKMCPLPNPIPTNKPNVEPKRPPKPIDLTPLCKLSPTLPNTVNVKWAADQGKGWVIAIYLVEKLTSEQLLERLVQKGTRQSEFTRELIKKKLNDEGDEIATTNLKVTVACPLGKMRMSNPCRPTTCDHLQCFDASLFLQMNERKPTWQCPVCDSPALYQNLMVDGYFQEVIKAKELPEEENEIILNQDGSWHPVPKDDSEEVKKKEEKKDENSAMVDLSDDEGGSSGAVAAAPAVASAPTEIECIDIE
eukprot:GFUD01061618.1.p1 GENE.GFUD01061618.1~~GFUD01061618.1.p1  ORF type:complete len:485 (-),score=149.81 GFUD01061618.1:30-1484(-)